MDANGAGVIQLIGIVISIALIAWGWRILRRKERGTGYYILCFVAPLIGLIVAACLKDLSEEEPSNDITDYNEDQ